MKTTFGRTCLILSLLGFALAAAVSVDLKARRDGVTVHAQVASMQLQGSPDEDQSAVAPEEDESNKSAACAQRDCPTPKQDLALMLVDDRRAIESKAFVAAGDEIRPKSKD